MGNYTKSRLECCFILSNVKFFGEKRFICATNEKKQLNFSCFFIGAGGRNRTRDPLITSQVLYQLSYTGVEGVNCGAGGRNRTRDPLITSQVLYQLSYTGTERRTLYGYFRIWQGLVKAL